MDITYSGGSTVRLRGRDVTVVVDPRDPARRPEPDLIVRTRGQGDPELIRAEPGRPQEVAGPGEYEIRGVSIFGLPAGDTTPMRVEVDEVKVLAVGALDRALTEDEVDALGHIDVLVVNVGSGGLGAAAASALVNEIEPGIVIPVWEQGTDGALDKFVKEMGATEAWTPQPKLSLSGSLGTIEETRVVVLEPRG